MIMRTNYHRAKLQACLMVPASSPNYYGIIVALIDSRSGYKTALPTGERS